MNGASCGAIEDEDEDEEDDDDDELLLLLVLSSSMVVATALVLGEVLDVELGLVEELLLELELLLGLDRRGANAAAVATGRLPSALPLSS